MIFRYLNMSLYPETGVRNQDSYKVKVFMNFKSMNIHMNEHDFRLLEELVETL